MNLTFTPIKPQTLLDGSTVYYRDAYATPEFWAFWQHNKLALNNQGIKIFKEQDASGNNVWKVRQLLTKPNDKYIPLPTTPYLMEKSDKLKPHQIPACEAIITSQITNGFSIDASDTGTGKTYMGLAMALELGYRPGIVCTKTGIVDWKRVCDYFKISPLFICNWESIRSNIFPFCNRKKDNFSGEYVYEWNIPKSSKIILLFDELHRAAGKDTQNKRIVLAAKDRKYRLHVMSATMADKMQKIETLGILIGLFTKETFPNWLRDRGLIMDSKNNWKSLNELEDMLSINKILFPNFGARLRKVEIPGFPKVQNIARLYELPNVKGQNDLYKKIYEQIKEAKAKGDKSKRLVLQLRYRQLTELKKVSLLIDLTKEYMSEGYSVAIFVNFQETLDLLCEKLKTKAAVHGKQVGKKGEAERRKSLDDFQANKVRKIVLNISAGGTGVNLHDTHGGHPRVSLICPTWNATELVQVLGRAHREGALSPAMNVLVYAAGTIEEKVYENVVPKIQNIHALNDGDLADFNFEDE